MLLANGVGQLWSQLSATPEDLGLLGAWIGLLAYTLQIYFDFSGYSDMACGLGRMLGFRFVQNFNYPYLSLSITDFWRRWHISLSTWFREYVYIPLGGNRKGPGRQAVNLLIVWMLTGIWHGASWNFLLWGLYYGLLLLLEKFIIGKGIENWPKALRLLYSFLLVMLGWCIFAFTDISAIGAYFRTLFGFGGQGLFTPASAAWCLGFAPLLLFSLAAATPLGAGASKALKDKSWFPPVRLMGLVVLFLLCVAALAAQSYNPFIYFRF